MRGEPSSWSAESPFPNRKPFDRMFQQRRKGHALDRTNRALRVRIKLAQGFDRIAKKFETHRTVGLRRKHIDDSSANRELAGHFHHVVEFVAHAPEMRNQIVKRDVIFPRKRPGLSRIKRRVGKPHARGGNGRNHHASQSGGISPQSDRASFEDFRMRRDVLPGQRVHGRKDGHFGGLLSREGAVEELQGSGQRLRLRSRRDQHDDGAAKFSGDLARDQSLGRFREPRQPLARRSLAKRRNRGFQRGMAAHRRQGFRNRGQNHT